MAFLLSCDTSQLSAEQIISLCTYTTATGDMVILTSHIDDGVPVNIAECGQNLSESQVLRLCLNKTDEGLYFLNSFKL